LNPHVEEGVEGPRQEGEGNINNRIKHEFKDKHKDAEEGVKVEEIAPKVVEKSPEEIEEEKN